jgi:hypothetical protein
MQTNLAALSTADLIRKGHSIVARCLCIDKAALLRSLRIQTARAASLVVSRP